jgi:hypothetical protein
MQARLFVFTWILEFVFWNLSFGSWNLSFGICLLDLGICLLEFLKITLIEKLYATYGRSAGKTPHR